MVTKDSGLIRFIYVAFILHCLFYLCRVFGSYRHAEPLLFILLNLGDKYLWDFLLWWWRGGALKLNCSSCAPFLLDRESLDIFSSIPLRIKIQLLLLKGKVEFYPRVTLLMTWMSIYYLLANTSILVKLYTRRARKKNQIWALCCELQNYSGVKSKINEW